MSKSQVAAEQVKLINPSMQGRIVGLTVKLSEGTEHTFDDNFWKECDVVTTALVSDGLLIYLRLLNALCTVINLNIRYSYRNIFFNICVWWLVDDLTG